MNKLEIKHKRTNEIIMTIEYKNSISGADLSGADLSGADLSWSTLSGTDLSGVNLRWTDLSKAKNINYDYLIGANTCVKKNDKLKKVKASE
ncbi:pentapeptide repeat-containing protein [Spiroplasma endosymbiont of Stenodema calcarata]|uniref:pentapeptide repeat-containing protein n=1 Tax=Spiroplasma endosymbiont of Stenodema calcarata TaxID=3139328 RepID=UPI003CCAD338